MATEFADMAQEVEHVLGKDEVTSSNLVSSSTYSSLAQSVERVTVNHDVVGSSPTGGATKTLENIMFSRVFCYIARSEVTSKNPFFKVSGLTHPNDC